MSQTIDQQFIEFIAKTIVTNPDEVKVDRTIDEKGVLLELTVAPDDLGRVIGRRGMTAQSMRTLLRALGVKNDARYNLKIVDVNGGNSGTNDSSQKTDTPSVDRSSLIVDDNQDISRSDETEKATETPEEKTEEEAMVEQKRKEVDELADLDI